MPCVQGPCASHMFWCLWLQRSKGTKTPARLGRAGQGLPSQLAAGVCASDSLGWCQLGWLRAEEGVRTAPVGQRGALRGQRQGKAAGDWGEAMDVVLTTIHTLARLLLQTDVLGTPPSTLESTLKGGVVVFLHP